ncbi:MAG TPA: glucosamine-6-phosphate deaminase [Cyanothece sp. UBA12306]|nr:glucosamine-6-phosphate deaminase [Cyanothece sp. UBA12306]
MKFEQQLTVDKLSVSISETEESLAKTSAKIAQEYLETILANKQEAAILLATGNSQLKFLDVLISNAKIDWSRLKLFHLDEYLGISKEHPASFRYYLREKVEKRVNPQVFHYLQGDTLEPVKECDRYTKLLQAQPIDLCCLGIGTNGHLAFNEPRVANFDDPYWVKLVRLEQETRQVQVDQGHFSNLNQVPQYALTVTIPMILLSKKILCLASGISKAKVIKTMLKDDINSACPASILRQHTDATLVLDQASSQLISGTIV